MLLYWYNGHVVTSIVFITATEIFCLFDSHLKSTSSLLVLYSDNCIIFTINSNKRITKTDLHVLSSLILKPSSNYKTICRRKYDWWKPVSLEIQPWVLTLKVATMEPNDYLRVKDCCECFVFKYMHVLTVQWTRNFQYCTKRSWVQYWKFRVHCTVSKCVYLKTKHELTVSNPFNIQFEFTAGDRLTMASCPTCLNEKTMNTAQFLCVIVITHSVILMSLGSGNSRDQF